MSPCRIKTLHHNCCNAKSNIKHFPFGTANKERKVSIIYIYIYLLIVRCCLKSKNSLVWMDYCLTVWFQHPIWLFRSVTKPLWYSIFVWMPRWKVKGLYYPDYRNVITDSWGWVRRKCGVLQLCSAKCEINKNKGKWLLSSWLYP